MGCKTKFTHSVLDQEFYVKKGWGDLKPKRCKECRAGQRADKKKEAVDKAAKRRKTDENWKEMKSGKEKRDNKGATGTRNAKDKQENRVEVNAWCIHECSTVTAPQPRLVLIVCHRSLTCPLSAGGSNT